jgi:hypothetical protein
MFDRNDDDAAIVVLIPLLLLLLAILHYFEKTMEKKEEEVDAMVNPPYREANSVVPSVSNMTSPACVQYPTRHLFVLP